MQSGTMELEALGYVVPFYHKLGFKLVHGCGAETDQLSELAVASESMPVPSDVELNRLFADSEGAVKHPLVQLLRALPLDESRLCGGELLVHDSAAEECTSAGISDELCVAYLCSHEGVHMQR